MNFQQDKHFLVSWNGITDLCSSMGFGGPGPILGALITGRFTDALILTYTKKRLDEVDENEQKEFAELIKACRGEDLQIKQSEIYEYIDKFANTPGGHELYFSWLKEELNNRNLDINIRIQECFLEFLNDSHGIYSNAIQAIQNIRSEYGKNTKITLFISPGTPVMAFSWALAALANSDMALSLLVSPDPRKAPETVMLPYQLIDSLSTKTNLSHRQNFDVIFHLYGEQPLPAAFGIKQFICQEHVLVTSDKYRPDRLKHLLPLDVKIGVLNTDPFSPQDVKEKILSFVNDHPMWHHIGFNLTGGTKMMYAGALSASGICNGIPFYFETRNHNLLWLNDYTSEPMKGLTLIDDFIKLNSMTVTRAGYWEDNPCRNNRIDITMELWKYRSEISEIYKDVAEYNDSPGKPFCCSKHHVSAKLDDLGKATLYLGEKYFEISYCPDFAKYISGGWLEEFAFLQIKPLLDSGLITDLRIGTEISWEDETKVTVQEFDVVFTDSKRLYFLECKAGAYKSEDIQKLQNNTRNYGGIDAKGIMVVCFPPWGKLSNSIRKRIKTAQNLGMFIGEAIPERLSSKVLNLSGDAIYTSLKK